MFELFLKKTRGKTHETTMREDNSVLTNLIESFKLKTFLKSDNFHCNGKIASYLRLINQPKLKPKGCHNSQHENKNYNRLFLF